MKKLISTFLLLTLLLTVVTPAFALEGEVTPSGLSFTEMEEQVEALMNEHVGTSVPGAAVVVVHEGEIIFSHGYGYVDIENQIPVDPAVTVFEYGSINKPFVWIAVMQLVEQGLLNLDEDVSTYLPDSFQFEKPFTMRDLMNHSPGFADFLLRIFYDAQAVGLSFDSLGEELLDIQPPQIFTPGTVSAYSNWGSALAAFIVEQISEQAYYVFERENILFPADMQNTLNQPDWLGNDAFLSNKATGHITDGLGNFQETLWGATPIYPAGAINGTAEDLARFVKALTPSAGETGSLFAYTDTLETIFTPSSLDPVNHPATHHGFITYSGALPTFGHSGSTVGFSTDFAIVPEARFGFVLLTNATGHMEFIPALHEILLGRPQTPIAGSNLPSAEDVEGHFVTARRYSGNFLEFLSYTGMAGIPIVQVNALDEITIEVSLMVLGSAVYVQTEPYIFQFYYSQDSLLFESFIPHLHFRIEDGVPVQVLVGNGFDFTSLPSGRSMPFLIGSLIIVVLSVMFFIIAPIVLFIIFLVRRKKQKPRAHFDRFRMGFLLSGTLLTLNTLILLGLFIISPFRSTADVAPFIWAYYVLTGLAVLFFAGSIWFWRTAGEAKGKRKVLFVITAVIMALFIALLWNWSFFVLL